MAGDGSQQKAASLGKALVFLRADLFFDAEKVKYLFLEDDIGKYELDIARTFRHAIAQCKIGVGFHAKRVSKFTKKCMGSNNKS